MRQLNSAPIRIGVAVAAMGLSLVAGGEARAVEVAPGAATKIEAAPKAEITVIHATKCDKKSVDPLIGEAPPALGYDCLKLIRKTTLPLVLNQPSTTVLPNGRTFQLLHTGKVDSRFKVTASISRPEGDKETGFVKLADITADSNKSFNVGGFAHQGGVLVLSVRIVP